VLTDSDCRLTGLRYDDVITIYGVSRAGYIPQLISLRLTSSAAVLDLLRAAGAKALVVDPSYSSETGETLLSLPIHFSLAVRQMDGQSMAPLTPLPVPASTDETVMIFHTSGSTGGSPKLVPCSAAWIDSVVAKAREACAPVDPNRRDVCTWM
jgi:acyl-coenzyme A synthetase/AMP-(fatty) acid ligase